MQTTHKMLEFELVHISIMTCLVYLLANGFTYHVFTSTKCGRPLKDILHELLPDLSRYVHIRDIVLACLFVPIMFVKHKLTFLIDVWKAFMMVITVKAVSIFFTFIPPSNPHCEEKKYLNHCYHSSTSGHAALTLILAMTYIQHGLFEKQKHLVYITVFMYCILILMTRAHYTVDIVQAIVVTWLITR